MTDNIEKLNLIIGNLMQEKNKFAKLMLNNVPNIKNMIKLIKFNNSRIDKDINVSNSIKIFIEKNDNIDLVKSYEVNLRAQIYIDILEKCVDVRRNIFEEQVRNVNIYGSEIISKNLVYINEIDVKYDCIEEEILINTINLFIK